ncbi:MAG: adenylosuccinate synthase [Clostridiales bacterium]|nr:adenylosuccinate synthase [Clostridiales bacterium]MDO4350894.1 adenylosuccinate synthase [Eubacteriales bacterium]MDY4008903.1 adenylosuccinate synthase [Candidatus Limiplasma sp.]
MVRTIVGANWGDEGKGKITDVLAENSDVVVRFQGGANAGHTIINNYGKFALHLLPSGVFHQNIANIIGPGVALDIEKLLAEYDGVVARGVPKPTLYISDRAQVMLPYHVDFDRFEEERLGKASFGSTKSGIAPFYGDKYLKIGIQVCQIYDDEILRQRLGSAVKQKNVTLENLYHKPPIDLEALIAHVKALGERIRPMVIDTTLYLHKALKEGKTVLLEGQLGSLRDPDHGIYPYTTSSSPLAGYGTVGAGVPASAMKDIFCVTKAYSSCVGAGPFTTEIFGDEATELRNRGGDAGEYGATTGRPRRVGWFDAVATRYGCMVQGATEAVLTNLDVLGYLDEIPVCTAYEVDGQTITDFPSTPTLERCKPVYTMLPGWKSDVRGVTEWDRLPENCRRYIEFIEKQLEVPIRMISTGPKRSEMLYR